MKTPLPLVVAAVAAAGIASVGAIAASSGSTAVNVTLKEFTLKPSVTSVPAGKVTFTARNSGKLEHEVLIMRTNLAPKALKVVGSKVKEVGVVTEIEDIAPGQTKKLTVNLKSGRYVLVCNVAGHYKLGQYAGLIAK